MSISEIMEKYKAGNINQDQAIDQLTDAWKNGEVSREDLNAGLKELAAGYSFKERTEEELAAKKQREDEEGFFNPEDRGLERKKMPTLKRPDMKRRKDLAGQVVRQATKIGQFDVTYNEDGYAVKATRV